jgi:hypothetical protein
MITADLISIIGNFSQSLVSVQSLITGFGYLIGILFMISGVSKLAKSRQKISVPIAYICGGAVLIFLPTSMEVLTNTLFGNTSLLEYTESNPDHFYSSMRVLIRTAGLLWFVRGCVLLVHASEPGQQHGPKGFAFVIAGILAMNHEYTAAWIDTLFTYIMDLLRGPA